MTSFFFIALGGALGALGRYWTGLLFSRLSSGFPLGTLAVNITGSFIIGLTASAIAAGRLGTAPWNDLIMLGFCGALTTFSTFSMDSFKLLKDERYWNAGLNLILSVMLCLGAAGLGLSIFKA